MEKTVKGYIKNADIFASNTNHLHVVGKVYNSDKWVNGHLLYTSRILKITLPENYNGWAYLVETNNSLYELDMQTAEFTANELYEIDFLYNVLDLGDDEEC